jgi:hypothetical protein
MSSTSLSARDRGQLELLAAGHYLLGALLTAGGGLALIPIVTGLWLHAATDTAHGSTALFDIYFVLYPLLALLLFWALAAWLVLAGVNISRHTRPTFCRITGFASLLCVPLGTVLGVLTVVVLDRPSVRTAFGKAPRPTAEEVP